MNGGRMPPSEQFMGLTRHPLLVSQIAMGNSWVSPMDSCFRRNGSGNGFLLSQEWLRSCSGMATEAGTVMEGVAWIM